MQDIQWEPTNGKFLLSVSLDQTTRAHAPWIQNEKEVAWRELARPQIHGYNMQCVCMVTSVLFVSGAEEKVSKYSMLLPYMAYSTLSFRTTYIPYMIARTGYK